MNNAYEQNVIEIELNKEMQLLKLKERKFYSRNDLDNLTTSWIYKCIATSGVSIIVTVIILHFCK